MHIFLRFLKFATSNPHKNIIFYILLLFSSSLATAQCPPDSNLYFSEQAHIDSFAAQYPSCDSVKGTLWIGGLFADGVTDLSGLSNIKTVGGYVWIFINPKLESLEGLESITTIKEGVLRVEDCNKLKSLKGLPRVDSVQYLFINDNPELKDLKGLDSLKCAYWIDIGNNEKFESLEGFNLDYTERLYISDNPLLANLEPLIKLKGHENLVFAISYLPSLTSLKGLDSLEKVKTLGVSNCDNLTDISALSSLHYAGANKLNGGGGSYC